MRPYVIGALVGLLAGCTETSPRIVPTALMLVSGNGQTGTVGQALPRPLVVKAVDLSGAGVPGVFVTWKVTGGGGGVNGDTTYWGDTDQSGQAMVTLTLGRAAGLNTVTARLFYRDWIPPVGFAATGLPGPPAGLTFMIQPSDVTAGMPIAPAVQIAVQDVFGNTVTDATTSITLHITGGTGTAGATLSGTLSQSAAAGLATFADLTIDRPGAGYSLTANAADLTGATSTAFAVNAGP
jgi:hypothetical protein